MNQGGGGGVGDSRGANHLQLWVSLVSRAETVIFPTGAGGASHLHIKLQIKRGAKTKWRFCSFTPYQHPDYLFSRPQWSISRIFSRFQVFSAINMQIKTHFNCSCNLKTICTLSTQLFFFPPISMNFKFSERSWAAVGVYMTGGPVKSRSWSILQTWLLAVFVVVLVDWEAAWHRWNPVTATVWLICWINDQRLASSPFRILNNLKGQITPQVGALPTGSRWCFECCWWVPSPWIQSEDKCRCCLCGVRKTQTTWTTVVYLNWFVFCLKVGGRWRNLENLATLE